MNRILSRFEGRPVTTFTVGFIVGMLLTLVFSDRDITDENLDRVVDIGTQVGEVVDRVLPEEVEEVEVLVE